MCLFLPTELKSAESSRDSNTGTGYIASFTALELLVAGYEAVDTDSL